MGPALDSRFFFNVHLFTALGNKGVSVSGRGYNVEGHIDNFDLQLLHMLQSSEALFFRSK